MAGILDFISRLNNALGAVTMTRPQDIQAVRQAFVPSAVDQAARAAFASRAGNDALGVLGGVGMTTPSLMRAFDLGKRVSAARNAFHGSETEFQQRWAYGRIPDLPSSLSDEVANWDMSDPLHAGFYEAGRAGELPTLITGTRYGTAPPSGRSYNYREQVLEPGVSMATADHPRFADYEWPDPYNKNRPVVQYRGYLLPMKGSDDEPLMVGLSPLSENPSEK